MGFGKIFNWKAFQNSQEKLINMFLILKNWEKINYSYDWSKYSIWNLTFSGFSKESLSDSDFPPRVSTLPGPVSITSKATLDSLGPYLLLLT